MNIKKTLQTSDFSLTDLNLVEKAVLHYAGLYKSTLRNKQLTSSNADNLNPLSTNPVKWPNIFVNLALKGLKKNCENTKNISFQVRYRKFSQQVYSAHYYYYRSVTEGKSWGRSSLSVVGKYCCRCRSQLSKQIPWVDLNWVE